VHGAIIRSSGEAARLVPFCRAGGTQLAKRLKTRTDLFAKDMCGALGHKCGLDWRPGKPIKGNRECVDVIGSRGHTNCVLIEIELRRGTPLGNVVKIWKQICREKERGMGKLGKKVILFQVFSRYYQVKGTTKKGTKQENAEFVGEQMSLACRPRIRYVPLSLNYSPGKRHAGQPVMRGAGRRKKHAKELAGKIISKLTRMRF